MKTRRVNLYLGLCLCSLLSIPAFGQEKQRSTNNTASCQAFVSNFYNWYLQLPVTQRAIRKSDVALKARPRLFSSKLLQQLLEDSEAQEKAGPDLVSLDADPFLGADGPAESYSVKKVTLKNGRCWAEVHGVWDGKESATPDVTPELLLSADRWVLVNFYFPSPSSPKRWNLLDELKAGRELRSKYGSGKNAKR